MGLVLFSFFLILLLTIFKFFRYSIAWQPGFHFILINCISVGSLLYSVGTFNVGYDTLLFYSGINFVAFLSLTNKDVNKHSYNSEVFLVGIRGVRKYFWVVALFNLIMSLFFLLSIDISLLMNNTEYLALSDVRQLKISNPILVIFHRTMVINGVLCAFLFNLFDSKRYFFSKYTFFLVSLFILLFQLANNSRSAALIVGGFLFGCILFERRSYWKVAKVVLLASIMFVLYTASIYGRGERFQGITQIGNNLHGALEESVITFEFISTNVFGGAYTFDVAKDMSSSYPLQYKILSFSPFPSVVDGFDHYREFQHRINWYTPYSSNVEVFHFGFFFIIAYFFILFIGLRLLNFAVIENIFIGLILALPAYLFFLGSQQYPLRSFFRFFLYSLIFCVFYLKSRK